MPVAPCDFEQSFIRPAGRAHRAPRRRSPRKTPASLLPAFSGVQYSPKGADVHILTIPGRSLRRSRTYTGTGASACISRMPSTISSLVCSRCIGERVLRGPRPASGPRHPQSAATHARRFSSRRNFASARVGSRPRRRAQPELRMAPKAGVPRWDLSQPSPYPGISGLPPPICAIPLPFCDRGFSRFATRVGRRFGAAIPGCKARTAAGEGRIALPKRGARVHNDSAPALLPVGVLPGRTIGSPCDWGGL